MKKLLILAGFVAALIGFESCSNDFDLIDSWKDIPVVYGIIAASDTAHYIRVEKAYLDENTSAVEIAQRVDSLYYSNAVVSLIRQSNGQEYVLNRIDGNLEGYPRESGVFADSPNYLYKLKFGETDSIRANERYDLVVNRGDGLPLVTGSAIMLGGLEIKEPSEGQAINWVYDNKFDVSWRPDNKETAVFFDVTIDIHFTEEVGGVIENKVIEWKVASNMINEEQRPVIEVKIPGETFYMTVAANVDKELNAIRRIQYLDFKVAAGGQELYDYIQVSQVNTGITGSQLIPNFTNMSEGYGIFSSANYTSRVHSVTSVTKDSLANGIFTKNLGFVQ